MSCCDPLIVPFFNTSSTTIGYGPSLRTKFGNAPNVNVSYWDGTQYVAAGIMTQVKFTGFPVTSIVVDHGSGSATGFVKIG